VDNIWNIQHCPVLLYVTICNVERSLVFNMSIYSVNFACGRSEPEIDFNLIQYMTTSGADKIPCKPCGPEPLTLYYTIL